MEHTIYKVSKEDHAQLIKIWEESVRATHDFLPHEEIDEMKPLILNQYFDAVVLHCCKNREGAIIGFIGVAECKIEMLFIAPAWQGRGVGSSLCQYALKYLKAIKVDVNEQNPRARRFYEKLGFSIANRSEFDGQGKPYPILHLELEA